MTTNPNALLHRRLPVSAIEHLWRQDGEVDIVETADIDIDLVRVGARHIKRVDAAHSAELVLRGPGIELIGGKIVLTAQELELLGWYDQVQNSFLGANRAIAFGHPRQIGGDTEAHPAAVAFAFHGFRHRTCCFNRRRHPAQKVQTAPGRAPARRDRGA